MAYIMAPKEESEINIIKKACQGTMDLFSKFLKEQIMDIVDKDKVKVHSHVMYVMSSFAFVFDLCRPIL